MSVQQVKGKGNYIHVQEHSLLPFFPMTFKGTFAEKVFKVHFTHRITLVR